MYTLGQHGHRKLIIINAIGCLKNPLQFDFVYHTKLEYFLAYLYKILQ